MVLVKIQILLTGFLLQVCVTLLTTALLVASACYVGSPPELRWWAAGNLVVSLGLAMANMDGLPDILNTIVGYGVLSLGLGLVLRGLRVHCSDTARWREVAVLTLLGVLIPAYFTLIMPSLRARLCFSGFYFALLNWICAATIARHGGWRGIIISVIGFTVLGLALFARGVHMLFHGDPADVPSSFVMGASMLAIPLAQVCIAFGLILMVMWRYAERLRRLSTLDALTGALNRAGLEIEGSAGSAAWR